MKKVLLIILGVIVLLAVISSLGGDNQPNTATETTRAGTTTTPAAVTTSIAQTTTAPAQTVTAIDLYAAYETNEVAADQTWGGQTVELSGTVKDIGFDIVDTPYVSLATDGLWSVQCFFSKDDAGTLTELTAGQEVTLTGTVDGLAIGTNLTVNDCQVAG